MKPHPFARLLASAPTLHDIERMVNQFFYSTSYHVFPVIPGYWDISSEVTGHKPQYQVVKKNNRFQFRSA